MKLISIIRYKFYYIPSLISIIMIMRSMKNNIYNRLSEIATEDLFFLRAVWTRLIDDRMRTPKHDYVGKCALRATLILEKRGALTPPLPHIKPIRASRRRT